MSIRLGLSDFATSKPPIAEYSNGQWRVWTSYNSDLSKGIFISLEQDGKMLLHNVAEETVLVSELKNPSLQSIVSIRKDNK
jgi:hypothetical protein